MRPKLAVITVTGCHLIPVIRVRREPTDLEHDRAVGRAGESPGSGDDQSRVQRQT